MDISALAIPLLSFSAVATAVFAATKISTGAALLTRRLGRFTGQADATADSAGAAAAAQADPAALQLLKEQKYSNWTVLNQMITGRSWAEREAAELARADLPLRVGEFMLIRWICAAGLALIGFVVAGFVLTGNVLLGFPVAAAAAGAGYFVPKLWVKQRQTKRRRKLDDQLVESLMMLASSLRSGYSFLQGMEAIAREMPPPISQEFDRVIQELAVGAVADETLLRMIERTRSEDLELAITAIMIQRQVGGELSGILETIVRTIRERQKIKRDIMTLTAQQRWSGYIIAALPVAVVAFMWVGNRGYMNELFFTLHGQAMVGIAVILEAIGLFMIKRIIAIEV